MARALTPTDAHVIMTDLVHQATGLESVAITDTSSFVSAGEKVLATGFENTLNALSIVLGRTFMAVRPYNAKLGIIQALSTDGFTSRLRKISFYSRDPKSSGDFNTNLNGSNLGPGRDNGSLGNPDGGAGSATPSMWEQNPAIPLEMNFAGHDVWEDSTTVYKRQLKIAFSSEEEFNRFMAAIMTEKGNDIESQKEAFNRLTMLNFMAGLYDLDALTPKGRVVNLTAGYNAKFGTNYTSAQLRTTYLKSFLEYFVSVFKTTARRLTQRTAKFHYSPTKVVGGHNHYILRHTPMNKQKVVLYAPLFTDAEAMVMPEIFNPNYLSLENYEGVDFWQAFSGDTEEDAKIKIVPAIPPAVNEDVQRTGETVELDYVVGMIFDTDALVVDYQLDDAEATPLEARKRYYNIWWSFAKNAINDYTENAILFIMADE